MKKFEEYQLSGYRRENGRVGVRNHVVILPVDDISNAAAEGVARLIKGTMALPHPYGRLQFGADLDLTFRTLIGIRQLWSPHFSQGLRLYQRASAS